MSMGLDGALAFTPPFFTVGGRAVGGPGQGGEGMFLPLQYVAVD